MKSKPKIVRLGVRDNQYVTDRWNDLRPVTISLASLTANTYIIPDEEEITKEMDFLSTKPIRPTKRLADS